MQSIKKLFPLILVKNLILITSLSFGQISYSQVDSSLKAKNLDEFVFSVNKTIEDKKGISQQFRTLTRLQIQSLNSSTTGDMLANFGVVSLQKSQQGGGSPTIRGFEASRILLVIDDVRMNNLIYRAGHLQNILTIDQSILDRAEVIYGPSSTVYGSDALGGAIHFYTLNPTLNGFSVGGYIRNRMPKQEKTVNGIVNIGLGKWASLSSITLSDFGDLKMGNKANPSLGNPFGLRNQFIRFDNTSGFRPDELVNNDDPLIQKYSGYQQADLLQKILFKPNDADSHILNLQYSTSTDVPRYDRLTDPLNSDKTGLKSSEWYYGPQKRLLTAYDFRKTKATSGAHIGINYQAIEESRHDRPFQGKFLRSRVENVNVFGLSGDIYRNNTKYEARYGVDFQYNDLKSTAVQKSLENFTKKALNTRYPDGENNMMNLAAYTTHSWILNDKFRITDGLRLGYVTLNSAFKDKTFFPFPYNEAIQNNFIYSGSLGVVFKPTASWKVSGMVSTGFRAPNVDDLAKVFDSAKGTLIVPNPNLKPEKTITYEIGITKAISDIFYWENVIYTTNFRDAIVVDAFTLDGKSTVVYDGTDSKILANQNKRSANIWGFSSVFNAKLCRDFSATASYNYTKGVINNSGNAEDLPLDHIPPSYGRIGMKYSKGKVNLEAFVLWNGWKKIEDYSLNGEDNEIYATPKGMPKWKTFNLRSSFSFLKKWMIQAGVDNIFDLQYRTFASGINAPGRNIFFTLRKNL